ncbi:ABC transporter permease [Bacilliculturomica massiliensis]|uniref:ABC transporter permease n=1 Tax=Bacilliculturomica massiliensis TaxID=1917867 RepID=UPI001030AA74|nr:ABC transporter permease [Bacilliculturomica massiliensis]
MRVKALAMRILWQMRRDKRTLALMIMAPIIVLTLVSVVLAGPALQVTVAVVNAPSAYIQALDDNNIRVIQCGEDAAREALETGAVTAAVRIDSGKLSALVDGSDTARSQIAVQALTAAQNGMTLRGISGGRPDLTPDITYLYGSDDLTDFDHFGPMLIGTIIFFFVFLVAGISFLQERNSGTLEKLLSSPVRRWEIVAGYVTGFGIFTVLQSTLISVYVIYVLDVMMVGAFPLVILVTGLTAVTALTLGILLSTAAGNEFQMIQFVPVVIVPQVFFSGIFELSPAMEVVGRFMPLYYVADALEGVMIRGEGLSDIIGDLGVLLCCAAVFMTANVLLLKRYRKI